MNTDNDHQPQWQRMRFKGNKVWLELDAAGQPAIRNGKVRIKYQLDQAHEYWVHPSRVTSLASGEENSSAAPAARRRTAKPTAAASIPETATAAIPNADQCRNAVCIYTDGACSGNPGPAGIGVVLRYKEKYKEISRYIGQATNNVAELEAIRTALLAVKNPDLPVIVFTDSSYALGLLSKGWKAKQNITLVAEIQQLAGKFRRLRFVKVKGHAGHPENERADRLAVASLTGKV